MRWQHQFFTNENHDSLLLTVEVKEIKSQNGPLSISVTIVVSASVESNRRHQFPAQLSLFFLLSIVAHLKDLPFERFAPYVLY